MKITNYNTEERNLIAKRLNHWFDQATDEEVKSGMRWYQDFNVKISHIHSMFDTTSFYIDRFQVAAVFAALSPRNRLEKNLLDTVTVLQAVRDEVAPENVKVCTFNTNKYKAFKFAKCSPGEISRALAGSPKVNAFIHNIGNLDPGYITIDIWMCRAIGITHSYLTKRRYDFIQSLMIREAEKIGIKGFQYQAVIWEAIRNNY